MSAPAVEERRAEAPAERAFTLRLETLAWAVVGLVFVLMRTWPIAHMPVGGAELEHLSGAWNASIGVEDDRYVPSLFQALTAGLLMLTSSEASARLLAFLATATIPAALYVLRPWLGAAGALLATLILALEPAGLALGAQASAMGFDLTITAWLFVLAARGAVPGWGWLVAAALVATAGPVPLPLVAAIAATTGLRRAEVDWRMLVWPAAGAGVGIVFTTLRPGPGPDGLTIAPFELFARGYEQDWSTTDGLDLLIVLGWPLVAAGLVAAGWRCYLAWRDTRLAATEQVLLLWAAFAFGWFVTSLPSHDLTPLASLSLPLALLLGPALDDALIGLRHASWSRAVYLLPATGAAIAIVLFFLGDWAKLDRVGGDGDRVIVTALVIAALGGVAWLSSDRHSAPTLLLLVAPLVAAPAFVASFVIAFRAGDSPLPSPVSTAAAREMRDLALESGGPVVIHSDFADALTWPFRNSGNVIVASRVPEDARFVVWPAEAPPPDGFASVAGDWSFQREVEPPTGDFFELARWYADRYSLSVRATPVAVYVREDQ